MNAQRILTEDAPDLEPKRLARSGPIRARGESELRLLGPTREQIAALDRPRLRGRFVHRHKGKALRQHALLPIRRTYWIERKALINELLEMSGEMSKFFGTVKPKRHTPPNTGG